MIRICDDLYRRPIHAVDGELGTVFDLYFDDLSWRIRYVVVEPGNSFNSRRVLLSPLALAEYDGLALKVHLTKQEIADYPATDDDKPADLLEKERAETPYSMVHFYSTPVGMDMVLPFIPPGNGDDLRSGDRWNRRLRSSRDVKRYALCTDKGRAGRIKDFLIDDRSWTITHAVFLPGPMARKTERLLEIQKIKPPERVGNCLHAETTAEALLRCPAFDRERHVNISCEELLHQLASTAPETIVKPGDP